MTAIKKWRLFFQKVDDNTSMGPVMTLRLALLCLSGSTRETHLLTDLLLSPSQRSLTRWPTLGVLRNVGKFQKHASCCSLSFSSSLILPSSMALTGHNRSLKIDKRGKKVDLPPQKGYKWCSPLKTRVREVSRLSAESKRQTNNFFQLLTKEAKATKKKRDCSRIMLHTLH